MFKFKKTIGIVSDTNIEDIKNITGNRRKIKTDNHSNLNFYIDDKNYTLSFMKSKIIDDEDKIKLLYVNLPFGRNEVLTIKNLTKNRDDFSSRLALISAYAFYMFLGMAIFFIFAFFISFGDGIFIIIPILCILVFLISFIILTKSIIFMKKNKKWLLEDDFKEE